MKGFLLLSFILMATESFAAKWSVVAETTSCDDKVQVLAQEGKKYVIAVINSERQKLYSKDHSTFSKKSMTTTEYVGDSITFIHPSYVEANPPKINLSNLDRKNRCSMKAI